MYLEVTERATRGRRRRDRGRRGLHRPRDSAFTSGADLAEMAAIATGTAVEGRNAASWACSTPRPPRGPVLGCGQRRRRRTRVHRAGPLRPRARRRHGPATRAVHRTGGATRSGQRRPLPRPHRLAAARRASCSPRTGSARRRRWSSAWPSRCAPPGPGAAETVALATQIAAPLTLRPGLSRRSIRAAPARRRRA